MRLQTLDDAVAPSPVHGFDLSVPHVGSFLFSYLRSSIPIELHLQVLRSTSITMINDENQQHVTHPCNMTETRLLLVSIPVVRIVLIKPTPSEAAAAREAPTRDRAPPIALRKNIATVDLAEEARERQPDRASTPVFFFFCVKTHFVSSLYQYSCCPPIPFTREFESKEVISPMNIAPVRYFRPRNVYYFQHHIYNGSRRRTR